MTFLSSINLLNALLRNRTLLKWKKSLMNALRYAFHVLFVQAIPALETVCNRKH